MVKNMIIFAVTAVLFPMLLLAQEPAENGGAAYLLGPDDVIRVTVEQHPELSGEFVVAPDGTVTIPNVGAVEVEGRSRAQLRTFLAGRIDRYVNSPRVNVAIVKYASQVIYVVGEVSRPGKYPTEGKIVTLRDAVLLAGLPTRFAADDRVYVISPSRKRPNQTVINLHRILYKGELKRNVELGPGDIVYVPQNFYGWLNDFFNIFLAPFDAAKTAAVTVP